MNAIIASLAAAATLLSASLVQAGEVELNGPGKAGILQENGVDLVVYYGRGEQGLEVTAVYPKAATPDETQRVRMVLVDGDDVTLDLPGLAGMTFSFAREGDLVRVTTGNTLHLAHVNP